jgi:hypothetical protein
MINAVFTSDAMHENGYTKLNPTGDLTLTDAVAVCKLFEPICARNGYHVALTGGCLYGEGPRKDIDLIFYEQRHIKTKPELGKIKDELMDELGFEHVADYGFVNKFQRGDIKVDVMLPDRRPQEGDCHESDNWEGTSDEGQEAFSLAKADSQDHFFDLMEVE